MLNIDLNFIKPFVEGTLHTLKVQCHTEATHKKPFMKGKGPKINAEIVAIIGITCSAFSGTIALYFSKQTFLNLMNNMLGEKFEEITPDLQDGAAELMNMIYGHAKRVLNAEGHDLQKAIPSIIRGTNLEASHLTNSPVIVLPFESTSGEFHIEIGTGESNSK
jgi:chemotaxis protein CheX